MADFPQNDFECDTSMTPDGLQAQIDELREQMAVLTQVDGAIIDALPKHNGSPRNERDRIMREMRASVERLREVASAAGAVWAEEFADIPRDDLTPEQTALVVAIGLLQQQDVGDTMTIGEPDWPTTHPIEIELVIFNALHKSGMVASEAARLTGVVFPAVLVEVSKS